jgi:hypothetical protein
MEAVRVAIGVKFVKGTKDFSLFGKQTSKHLNTKYCCQGHVSPSILTKRKRREKKINWRNESIKVETNKKTNK